MAFCYISPNGLRQWLNEQISKMTLFLIQNVIDECKACIHTHTHICIYTVRLKQIIHLVAHFHHQILWATYVPTCLLWTWIYEAFGFYSLISSRTLSTWQSEKIPGKVRKTGEIQTVLKGIGGRIGQKGRKKTISL